MIELQNICKSYKVARRSAGLGEAVAANPNLREYILNRARPWPAPESLFISGEYIVLVLDDAALAKAQAALSAQP